ncbi:MAG: hypothetical protein CMH48_15730 [Muricauda sp.]|uniref:Uncharacterized protein n=1 Tax=Flagellimonas lutaonensis TaxID=516051 RepID=A0A0D5YT27_9FLAO|nr:MULTISPECIES: membrane protein [Allomuricauda]AKA35487.1 hypothetical protein VC82_1882 [Allomuricauda lutaonensis]MBC32276.1 hypothetical protein [Allomuricauda sp.]|tara:strand:+ start:1215 stop:1655 length:441 start_codon:yes stop_codon:yes gene_type:complete
MNKIVRIVLIIIGLVAAVLWFSMPDGDDPNAINSTPLNLMFWIMYLLLAIAVIFSLFFGLKKLFSNPASLKKTLFALAGLAVIVAISYGLSSDNAAVVSAMADRGVETTESTVKTIGMGLNVFFILTAIAVALMVIPGLKKMFTGR